MAIIAIPALANDENPVPGPPADSEAFWERFTVFESPLALDVKFESLAELSARSDLIVRGRIADLFVGEEWVFAEGEPAVPLVYVTVAIDDVLKGAPVSRNSGRVEILMYPVETGFDPAAHPPPSEEYVWFLIYEPTWRIGLGKPPVTSAIGPFAYFRPNFHQSVFRNQDGAVAVPLLDQIKGAYGDNTFPVVLDGADFDVFLSNILESGLPPLGP